MVQGRSFETDAAGNLVGVPTNLKVDGAGNVIDANGNVVGKAGEVYVDAEGNAVNASGQIVGYATAAEREPATVTPVSVVASPNYVEPTAPVAPAIAGGVASAVINSQDYHRDASGSVVSAPTNLTVDSAGNVVNAQGQIVGRAGEVFLDASGHAINASGQIVGTATTPVSQILDSANSNYQRGVTMDSTMNDGATYSGRTFAPNATDGLAVPGTVADPVVSATAGVAAAAAVGSVAPVEHGIVAGQTVPTNLFVDANGNVHDAAGNVLGKAGEVVADADGNVLDASGRIVGRTTGAVDTTDNTYASANAYADPRNKYLDGVDGVEQNRYGDGVYGAGDTFFSRAFGQNPTTDMLDNHTPEQDLTFMGRNDASEFAADAATHDEYMSRVLGDEVPGVPASPVFADSDAAAVSPTAAAAQSVVGDDSIAETAPVYRSYDALDGSIGVVDPVERVPVSQLVEELDDNQF
jgi:hypothetical protein